MTVTAAVQVFRAGKLSRPGVYNCRHLPRHVGRADVNVALIDEALVVLSQVVSCPVLT